MLKLMKRLKNFMTLVLCVLFYCVSECIVLVCIVTDVLNIIMQSCCQDGLF